MTDGLSWQGVVWAFTTMEQANWHPLTWLSHMADCQFFGLNAGGHHLVNVAIHGVNSCLLYLAWRRMTGLAWRSGMVAALFALHPLHVESVAWVAERKDVLSTMFGFAALWAYAGYAQRPSMARYLAVLSLFAAGLLAKPMLVTLPLLFLLLDYWPLGRFGNLQAGSATGFRCLGRLLREKLPMFALAAASCVITLIAQYGGSAVVSIQRFPISSRLSNAALAYVGYLTKTFLPVDLAPFYPHPLKLQLATFDRGGSAAAGHLHRTRVGRSAAAVPAGRLALVPGRPGAGHRTDSGGRAVDGRPVYLLAAGRDFCAVRVVGG